MSNWSPFPTLQRIAALNGNTVHLHVVGYPSDVELTPDYQPPFDAAIELPCLPRGRTIEEAAIFYGYAFLERIAMAYTFNQVPDDMIWEAHVRVGINPN